MRACSPGAPVVCACSVLLRLCFNAGVATENSSEQVLIVLALSCYQNVLWFVSWELNLYFCASLFLKIQNPKLTNLAGSLDGAPIHNTISKTKTLFRDRSILKRSFTQLAFDASLVFTDCSAIATATCDLRACCAAVVRSHNTTTVRSHNTTPPLRPRRGLTPLGGRHNVESAEQAQGKKLFQPRHVLATEA